MAGEPGGIREGEVAKRARGEAGPASAGGTGTQGHAARPREKRREAAGAVGMEEVGEEKILRFWVEKIQLI